MIYNFYRRRIQQELGIRFNRVTDVTKINRKTNTLVFYVNHELAKTQIYPLIFYKSEIQSRYGQQIQFLPIEVLEGDNSKSTSLKTHIERVFVQTPLNTGAAENLAYLSKIARNYPKAKICYLDWMAPIDTRCAQAIDNYIDAYITKQHFRALDRSEGPFIGDSNLSDFYYRRMELSPDIKTYPLPAGFNSKLVLGSNFGFSPQMVDMFLGSPPKAEGRDIDFHARIAVSGVDWYARMRQEALHAAQAISGISSVMKGRVRRPQFFAEMRRSKLCFSPFGYGEVCWRDFEAFATGALLVKPNVDHLKTFPDIFVPDSTYVSVAWDLSDLESKVRTHLALPERRAEMIAKVHGLMQQHISKAEPLMPFLKVIERN